MYNKRRMSKRGWMRERDHYRGGVSQADRQDRGTRVSAFRWRGLSQEFNDAMSSWCGSNGVTQIDATQGFILDNGYLDESKTVDKLHFF